MEKPVTGETRDRLRVFHFTPENQGDQRSPSSQLLHCAIAPPQHPQCAQGVPAACQADGSFHLQWDPFAMTEVEGPAAVLVAAPGDDSDGVTDAAVGLESGISQIIEPAQDVVVPKRRE